MTSLSIPRTATFAWSRGSSGSPLLATGTVTGALDESFTSSGSLELWDAFADESSSSSEGGERGLKGKVSVSARFNRLAWSAPTDDKPEGVLAAGMENGELGLWDPAKIVAGATTQEEASIFDTDRHKGSVRGLAWNTLHPNLFASGATDAEIFIWDTKNLSKPYGPAANKSRHLSDITALAWNPSVAHILATASASGSTVVWDLKGRQEVIHLSYLGGQGSVYSQGPKPVSSVCWHSERGTRVITASEDDTAPVILVWDLRNYRTPERVLVGHEKGILSLDWCKADPELLISCGKDCRTLAWNPSTGEMVGELPATTNWSFDTAFCPRNSSYVATASFDGKIGITNLQNTSTSSEPAAAPQVASDNAADIFSAGNLSNLAAQVHPGVSLKQPPRWLKRPAANSFGFGGKLASVSAGKAAAPAPGGPAGATLPAPIEPVKLRQVVTENDVVERALKLENATDSQGLADFCDQKRDNLSAASQSKDGGKAVEDEIASWKLLASLFKADSRDELVSLLGFSKDQVKENVEQAIKSFRASSGRQGELPLGLGNRKPGSDGGEGDDDDAGSVAREPLVTFAEHTDTYAKSGSSEGEGAAASQQQDQEKSSAASGDANSATGAETTASETTEASQSATSEATTKLGGPGSEITEPSLFGDDAPGTPQNQATADFYSTLSAGNAARPATLSDRFHLSQQHIDTAGSSVAATIGSRPSSAASDKSLKPSTFRIYPQDESEADRLLTRALVLGDFDSAVSLCLSADRFADALLLAVRGGPELLAKTQKAYFERRTTSLPYLRLFQSIISDDLTDVVQNADLRDWQEVFVVLCTFAKSEEYAALVDQLGQRLEYQFAVAKASSSASVPSSAVEQRRSAVLCYLAAGKLEKVVGIWIDEMLEEEKAAEQALHDGSTDGDAPISASSRYSAHSRALQSFIEKVTVFKSAVAYVDTDLAVPTTSNEVAEAGARTYKLAALYDRYHEYAELLAAQGLVSLALKYAALTPADYRLPGEGISARDRLQFNSGKTIKAPSAVQQQQQASASKAPFQSEPSTAAPSQSAAGAPSFYNTQVPPAIAVNQQQIPQQPQQAAYDDPYRPAGGAQQQQPSYSQAQNPYAPVSAPQNNMQNGGYNQYAPPNGYAPPGNASGFVPATPAVMNAGASPSFGYSGAQQQQQQPAAPLPPKKKEAVGGWNDAPVVAPKRTGSAAGTRGNTPAPEPITSPFPNQPSMSPVPNAYGRGVGPQGQGGAVPPPPPARGQSRLGQQAPPPPQQQQFAPPPMQQGSMAPQQFQQGGPGFQQRPPQGYQGGPPPPQGMMPPQQQRFGGPPQGQYGPPQGQYGQGPPQGFQQQPQYQQGPPPPQQRQPPQQQAVVPPPPPRRG